MVSEQHITSPCIGVCSTGIGDSVCRGCKRFSHEVIKWNAYDADGKRAIQRRLQELLTQVVKAKIHIIDESLLQSQLEVQRVRFNRNASPYCWVFDLLKAGARQIDDLTGFGCRAVAEYASMNPVDLKDVIDQDFYLLSCVHYERYFQASV